MPKRAERSTPKQGFASLAGLERMRQLLFPMIAGIAETRRGLMQWTHQVGLEGLRELLDEDAERLAGPKGRHNPHRSHHHWGSANVELPFGGRRVVIRRPRVRHKRGGEVQLPLIEQLRDADPLAEHVVNQILLGVSTRGYEASLAAAPPDVRSRGTSKSAVSRRLVKRTREKLQVALTTDMREVELAALLLDGIGIGDHTLVVALGVRVDGTKVPLGLWLGSTENHTVCTALLQNLLERGLRIERPVLCVIDGGKGLRKALHDVLGDRAVIQRCTVHKRRNVREHLPKSRQRYVERQMSEAYASTSADLARRRLRQVATWLERNGEHDAAASVREGLEETLTVVKLGLTGALRRTLSTTNPIENVLGSVRRVTRNVKRWRGGEMARRWAAVGLMRAQERFRRLKGHRDMPALVAALSKLAPALDREAHTA